MNQHRALIRARGLTAFRRALADLAVSGSPLDARRRAIIVPTQAAGELLRQTIEADVSGAGGTAVILPDLVTRHQWLVNLHGALVDGPLLLSRVEREVLFERAARDTGRCHPIHGTLFDLRPGLVAAMLDFYDALQRRQRGARRFVRTLFKEIGVEYGSDRGSESLIRQTRFLGFAFLAYERAVAESGGVDEHGLRRLLIARQPQLPFNHLVLAVADHPSDPRGLWPADFDLIGRLSNIARIDIVVTDEVHDAGFRERLERELPGIVERRAADVPRAPRLLRPPATGTTLPVFVYRDREEELREVARAVRAGAEEQGGRLSDSVAIVFQRPLPYLYLAQQVLVDARVPYQAFDALPLAAEPYAALADLVLSVARTGGTREAALTLLRSPLMRFDVDGRRVELDEVAALDLLLKERRATGEARTYPSEADAYASQSRTDPSIDRQKARRAARAAAAVHQALLPFRAATQASDQIGAVAAFLRRHEELPKPDDPWRERHVRARAAVLSALDELAGAFERHDNRRRDPEVLTALVHHTLEGRTFAPRRGDSGVHLLDAVAARFGDFDDVHVVGLVDAEWPERPRQSIFYSTDLLKALGWPQQADERRAEQAAFRDLLSLARRHMRLSAFQLEGDAVASVSPLVEAARDVLSIDAPAAHHAADLPGRDRHPRH